MKPGLPICVVAPLLAVRVGPAGELPELLTLRTAEAPELFQPVTGSEKAMVRAKNEYFLKRTLYCAKRHRIVRVNAALLLKLAMRPATSL